MIKHTVATLKSGVRVANFSSPHPFTFTDGTILPACDAYTANTLRLDAAEIITNHPNLVGIFDIGLTFSMTDVVQKALDDLENDSNIDIVLVPLPVKTAMEHMGRPALLTKCRVCRVADRVSKTIFADKFCL